MNSTTSRRLNRDICSATMYVIQRIFSRCEMQWPKYRLHLFLIVSWYSLDLHILGLEEKFSVGKITDENDTNDEWPMFSKGVLFV